MVFPSALTTARTVGSPAVSVRAAMATSEPQRPCTKSLTRRATCFRGTPLHACLEPVLKPAEGRRLLAQETHEFRTAPEVRQGGLRILFGQKASVLKQG